VECRRLPAGHVTAGDEMKVRWVALPNYAQFGFSLIELMVVLAIATTLLAVGVPGFRALIQSLQVTTTVNDFLGAINLARSEAIKRGGRVDMMPDDGNDWAKGWVVFINRNDTREPDARDDIIVSHGPVPDGIAIQARLTDLRVQLLSYNGTGRTHVDGRLHIPQFGSFSFLVDGKVKKNIVINFLGRPRVCTPLKDSASC
jgi:type IV fimbrial biogenesis protein FimT